MQASQKSYGDFGGQTPLGGPVGLWVQSERGGNNEAMLAETGGSRPSVPRRRASTTTPACSDAVTSRSSSSPATTAFAPFLPPFSIIDLLINRPVKREMGHK